MSILHTHLTRRFERLLLVAGVLVATAALPLVQAAQAGPSEPVVPTRIEVPAGNKLFLVGHATGVQIYSCNPVAGGYAWGLLAPWAVLVGDHGERIATHFGGPTWQATDGSRVVGQRIDGVSVDPTAVPWLLLSRTSRATGLDGDRLYETTYIQRIATAGGLPPAPGECDATSAGEQREIPYTADYYFWKASGSR